MTRLSVLLSAVLLTAHFDCGALGAFLEPVGSSWGTNLIRNSSFELGTTNAAQNWSTAPGGFQISEGRTNSRAIACFAVDDTGWRGVSQTLTLNRTNTTPIQIGGWSRAEAVSGTADPGYAIYVDIIYNDGTPLWGQTANFSTGTHDWERRDLLIIPEKPVRTITVHCLLRGHSGRVWFDDIWLNENAATGETFVFQGASMVLTAQTNPIPVPSLVRQTADGLQLGLAGSRVSSVKLDGQELAAHSGGGFMCRDMAADSPVYAFEDGKCPELGLQIDLQVLENPTHLMVQGQLTNLTATNRSILLLFALPIDAGGANWHDDIRRVRQIGGTPEFNNVASVGCGSTGTMSLYPLSCISGEWGALNLALDMGNPAIYRLVYHPRTRQFFIAFDFALASETAHFPNTAPFRFVTYRSDPKWGFRGSLAKLHSIFPEYFAVRSTNQGIWMPFTDVSTVQGWEDFGFRYHEGDNNVAWDDDHGVLSFRYTEPMTWWMSMATNLPRTLAEAIRVRDEYADGPSGNRRTMAQISRTAAMLDSDGNPALLFRNEPWANGAVWSLNPNPHLPISPNAATVYWNDHARARYTQTASTKLDGEYLDSIEGYVTASLNFNREHFQYTTVPLTFSTDTRKPALFKGLAAHEFTKWISDDVHRVGGLVFANGVPYRFSFLCPWLDVLGTETDWMPGGVYTPVSDAQLCLWRSMAGAKPYLLLLNTDYSRLTPEMVERYFLRSLAFGMFPSMFSHNAAEDPYWRNPAWYNRDRALFKKYIPIIKEVAEAGWQPITAAHFEHKEVQVEKFGNDPAKPFYFTLLNDGSDSRSGLLKPEMQTSSLVATELLSGTRLPKTNAAWLVTVPSKSTAVVKIEKGPSFSGIERSENRVRVTVTSPVQLEHVVETTMDLNEWSPLVTNTPAEPSYTLEVALDHDQHFLRLRW